MWTQNGKTNNAIVNNPLCTMYIRRKSLVHEYIEDKQKSPVVDEFKIKWVTANGNVEGQLWLIYKKPHHLDYSSVRPGSIWNIRRLQYESLIMIYTFFRTRFFQRIKIIDKISGA